MTPEEKAKQLGKESASIYYTMGMPDGGRII